MIKNNNKVFCMLPWVHVYVESDGTSRPCCIGSYGMPYGPKNLSMRETLNTPMAKLLRKNMINGIESSFCTECYKAEAISPHSLRSFANHRFGSHYDEVMANTDEDGTLHNIKLRYIDIRFSNICNFKCRSCGPLFSSLWAAENKKDNPDIKILQKPRDDDILLQEVLDNVEYIEQIYFAGGEPLITDEHYIILEELIKKQRTDILLRYNSNCSVLNYKDKNLLDLWKHFKEIEFCASIDHYGKRAEYIRNGTDWAIVEKNLLLINSLPNIKFSINTVLSIFNYLTLEEFYSYIIDKNIINRKNLHLGLYRSNFPKYMSAKNLPQHIKDQGRIKNTNFSEHLRINDWTFHYIIDDAIKFVDLDPDNYNWQKDFIDNTTKLDAIRGEDFIETFPELISLFP